jgi:putative transposase
MTLEQKSTICEFRYSLIAELANPHLPKGSIKRMIKEKAKIEYEIPYSTKKTICEATIKKWLYRYKKFGKEALLPQDRFDKDKTRSISEHDAHLIITYLETNPQVSAKSALKKLKEEGKVSFNITKSSMSRFLISRGLDKKQRLKSNNSNEHHLKFNFQYPLECVQADCMYSLKLKDEKNKLKNAILIAFIDDATRRIVYSEFTFTEKSLVFEKGIKHILKSHGKIGKLYVDNGSTFVSNQTKRILSILDIILVHSRPGRPAGRGKIERFFRTVQDQFIRILDKESVKNINDLNIRFKTWLETEYHRTPHKGIDNITPLDAWLSKTKYLIQMKQDIDIDKIFLHETSRRVYKDNTITLDGVLYEVPPLFSCETIKIYYDPFLENKILEVYKDGKYYGLARPVESYANTKIKRNFNTRKVEDAVSVDKEKSENRKNTAILSSLNAAKIDVGEIL